ncbi:MAG: sugar ABC transporter substrate-binding protein [Oscillospiraceae bacterium]
MKKRRVIALLLVAVMLMVCMAGCTTEEKESGSNSGSAEIVIPEDFTLTALDELTVDTSKDNDRDPYDIGVMFVDMANEYYVTTAEGCEARSKERNCNYTVTSSNNNSSEDIRLIENYINSGVDAVIACYYSTEATEDISKACMEAGIPLVLYCFGNKYHTSEIVSDNYKEGEMIAEMAADYVKENLADKEEVKVAFGTISSVEAMATRCDGMVTKFMELVPNAVDVGITEDLNSTAKAYDWAEKVLLTEPDVDLFVCFCDAIAIGAAEALKDAGYTGDKASVFGMDGSASAVTCIAEENGVFKATIGYDLYAAGQSLVDIAIACLDGQDVAYAYEYPAPYIIDASNVKDYM